jgi:hypothetical protein
MPGGTEICVLSATGIADPSGQVFANGTYQVIFKPNNNVPGPYVDVGVSQNGPNFIKLFSGNLDGTGSFSINNIVRSDSINPTGSKWTLIVAPNANGQAYSVDLVLNAATVDCTAAINAVITNVQVQATMVAHAYKDAEVIPIPGSGGLYYDVVNKVLKVFDITTQTWITTTTTSPSGTGFIHVTAGVTDGAAKAVDVSSADINGVLKASGFPALTGDVTTIAGALATTLATVATPGTGTKVTVNAKGLTTSVANASLASADFANQGTATTVLHGNVAGNPSFGAVALGTDVSGTLLAAQFPALTGDITTNAGALATTLATVATPGTSPKVTFNAKGLVTSGTTLASGDIPNNAANTSGSAALVVSATANPAVAGVVRVASGDTINFRNNANSGDLTIAKTGAVSGLVAADTLNLASFGGGLWAGPLWGLNSIATDTTHPISIPVATDTMAVLAAAQTLLAKRITPRQVAMADATSVTPTSDTADINTFVSTQAGGTLTVNAPSGTPTDGQKLILRLKSTNAQTYSFNATYAFSTSVTAPTTLAAGKTDYIGLLWNATNTKWDVVSVDQGH